MAFALIAIVDGPRVDTHDMPSRVLRTVRPAAALLAAAALVLTAPAAGLANSRPLHSGPIAHVALGLMDSGARHSPRHHAVKRHRHANGHAGARH